MTYEVQEFLIRRFLTDYLRDDQMVCATNEEQELLIHRFSQIYLWVFATSPSGG
jgi:hypothetical protein